jgi:uncharacterized damage-inducible protein DinB
MIPLLASLFGSPLPEAREKVLALEERMRGMFTRQQAVEMFGMVGPPEPPEGLPLPAGATNTSSVTSSPTHPAPLRIEPIAGYSPAIGRLAGMLTYARSTTIAAVDGLAIAELDHLHDAKSNSIGALLAHITAVERSYQVLTFEERTLSPREQELLSAALKLGANGQHTLRGRPLEHYLDELTAVRKITLESLAARDDDWLDRSVTMAPRINAHWAWFHVAEDEINHRGQIRWLRARLPNSAGHDDV